MDQAGNEGRTTNHIGVHCPKCKGKTQVIDSRGTERKEAIRRRRKCLNPRCRKRFTTYEIYEPLFFEINWARQFRMQLVELFKFASRKPKE